MDTFITFRCTDRLFQYLCREADSLGLSRSQYIRAVLWRSVGSSVVRSAVADMHMTPMFDDCEVIPCEDDKTDKHHIF